MYNEEMNAVTDKSIWLTGVMMMLLVVLRILSTSLRHLWRNFRQRNDHQQVVVLVQASRNVRYQQNKKKHKTRA
ncbi:hypothetical protein CAEBREN_06307 [Caenorhabditis brenneri]|uniref:Uncharacterized protein n=1 Tax=Caenorhabditis brenneri TaxID=135651 RepID=G0NXM8_CAEBE|nr:hypothetical protein CAEBREN_06307 [Caenorhabditis brenneri]